MATHRLSTEWPRLAWRVLIVALILPTAVTWLYFVALHGTHAALQQSAYALLKGCQFALPVFAIWMWAGADMWRVKFRGVGVGRGVVFGLLVVLLLMGVYEWLIRDTAVGDRLQQSILEKLHSMGLATPVKFILVGVFYAVIHSGLEEY
ncbi:MAG TPA: hypothetical protein PKD54_11555, partial [Pirellulaceae bacterium]|nr:hypothetical protein [Pirellulaceae bacterium]